MLDAAHELLLESGEAPALPQVAERAGMARTSIYQYFDSRADLLRAMVRDVYPRWTERVTSAMDAAPTEADRVLAYAVANLQLVAEGTHAIGSALAALAPEEELDEQATRMHREIQEPLIRVLASLEVDSPEDIAALVSAVVHGASRTLESGVDIHTVIGHVTLLLGPLVRELGGSAELATGST